MSAPHEYLARVRWSDVDAYGHVNNVTYFEYFQEARIAFLGDLVADAGATSFVVARVAVHYRRPIFFRHAPYRVLTEVTRLGRSSFTLRTRIVDDEDGSEVELARGEAVVVGFDATTQRSRPLVAGERAVLETALGPDADPEVSAPGPRG